MNMWGNSASYHGSESAVIQDEEIIAAESKERFTRKKHDPWFPMNARGYSPFYAGLSIDELDAVLYYDKPFPKIRPSRILLFFCSKKAVLVNSGHSGVAEGENVLEEVADVRAAGDRAVR
jgi:predicted NodU family carbamoyl transferase